ncbi:MAG: hypothetical protein Q7R33_01760 [Nitrosarchaeum sp.]|nr:hypothetical protein [Nitrosarchaeum sp.]
MIEIFKTYCILPDKSIGEVCKRLNNDWLVCNANGWWKCSTEWIEQNTTDIHFTERIL